MAEASAGTIRAIDSHAHVFERGLPLTPVRRHAPDYDAGLSTYIALLDAHEVSHAVLVQPSFLGTDNSFLLSALAAQPHRLRGVAVVSPDAGEADLRDWDRRGICGIRLNLVGAPMPDLRTCGWPRLLDRVRAMNWHVEVHREMDDLPVIGQQVLESGCRLVVDHFGRPSGSDAGLAWLLGSASTGRTWVKLSAAYRNWPRSAPDSATRAARRLVDAFGPGRLVWGSDWPHTQHREQANYSRSFAALADWVPDAEMRHAVLVDTPRHLFNFNESAHHV